MKCSRCVSHHAGQGDLLPESLIACDHVWHLNLSHLLPPSLSLSIPADACSLLHRGGGGEDAGDGGNKEDAGPPRPNNRFQGGGGRGGGGYRGENRYQGGGGGGGYRADAREYIRFDNLITRGAMVCKRVRDALHTLRM